MDHLFLEGSRVSASALRLERHTAATKRSGSTSSGWLTGGRAGSDQGLRSYGRGRPEPWAILDAVGATTPGGLVPAEFFRGGLGNFVAESTLFST